MTESKWRRYGRIAGPDLDADIRDEIEFHLQTLADKHIARGALPDVARTRALAEFGDLNRAREACMEIGATQQRATRRAELLGNFSQDVRQGARLLIKNPPITAL